VDLGLGKLRPALLLARVPGEHEDWLISMISSQLRLQVPGFDEVVGEGDADYPDSGLKVTSLIRVGRLAVAEERILLGSIGQIATDRLRRIKSRLSEWLSTAESV
jgi:mRNA interferase MazF